MWEVMGIEPPPAAQQLLLGARQAICTDTCGTWSREATGCPVGTGARRSHCLEDTGLPEPRDLRPPSLPLFSLPAPINQ